MSHQMHQFDYLNKNSMEKILSKSNCCNDELCSNAEPSDVATESPIWLSRTRIEWEKYISNLIVVIDYLTKN